MLVLNRIQADLVKISPESKLDNNIVELTNAISRILDSTDNFDNEFNEAVKKYANLTFEIIEELSNFNTSIEQYDKKAQIEEYLLLILYATKVELKNKQVKDLYIEALTSIENYLYFSFDNGITISFFKHIQLWNIIAGIWICIISNNELLSNYNESIQYKIDEKCVLLLDELKNNILDIAEKNNRIVSEEVENIIDNVHENKTEPKNYDDFIKDLENELNNV